MRLLSSARRCPVITVQRIDPVVITVADLERSIAFYERVLGMTAVRRGAPTLGVGGDRAGSSRQDRSATSAAVVVFFRDPDGNLIEVSNEVNGQLTPSLEPRT
jgi:catechol 2,3-dioxygenase-like lactoylglutathione lyase family enzyme